MATLTLRPAAVTYSCSPKGIKAWQLLLDWLTPAERARLNRREVEWVRTVARNTHGNIKRCYKVFIRLPSSPWPPCETRIITIFFLAGGILLVHHHYMQDSSPLPLKPSWWQWWSFRVRANDGVWPKIYYELGHDCWWVLYCTVFFKWGLWSPTLGKPFNQPV